MSKQKTTEPVHQSPAEIRGWGPFLLASEVNAPNSPGVNFASKNTADPLFSDRLIEIIGAYSDYGQKATEFYDRGV